MTWWVWLLLAWIPVAFLAGVVIGRSADRMGIPDDGEPSGPRVRIEGRR
jgi:hypothetical protein